MASGFVSGEGVSRRSAASSSPSRHAATGRTAPLHPDIDPPPKPWPALQFLAFGAIVFFALVQFLPPTHFRDPRDPLRNWIPFDSDTLAKPGFFEEERGTTGSNVDDQPRKIHIVTWMECLDLRMLAVLANSTLANSRYPEQVHFHFFTPEGDKDRVSYYKLKVLFPHTELEIMGQKEAKELLEITTAKGEYSWPSHHDIAPFIIPRVLPYLGRFIYISPELIMKGKVEELLEINLENNGIAVVEDCSKNLGAYVNFDILNAIQRSAAKPWVSRKAYEKNACIPELNLLIVDSNKLDQDIIEAILWWSRVLNLGNQRKETYPAIVLSLYNKTLKLSSAWKMHDLEHSKMGNETNIIRFDGPRKPCSSYKQQEEEKGASNLWEQYLPPSSNHILSG